MKRLKSLLYGLMAFAALGGATACQDDIDTPDFVGKVPVASLTPNSTILEVKEAFWKDNSPYCEQVGTKDNGEHYIVHGRVISNDYQGNIFKSLYIQDETAVLPLSINQYNLYMNYRVGQEVVIDLTGMYIGKYSGLVQMGYPQWSAKDNAFQPTFMAPGILEGHIEANGLPEPSKVDTLLVNSIQDLVDNATDPAYLRKMQGQLIRVNNVKFDPQNGVQTLGLYHENTNQKVVDENGNALVVRTSGYSTFWNMPLPTESGDVVGILGYFINTSNSAESWQLVLIDADGLMNFGNPTLPKGTKDRPWSVDEAVEQEVAGSTPQGWVQGFIVGTVAPEVENITSDSQIEWGAQATLSNSVVIGATPETRDLNSCLIVSLPQGSVMRQYVALAAHPENLGKTLAVYGTLDKNMGVYGVVGNTGTASEFVLEGVDVPDGGDTPVPSDAVSSLDENFDALALPAGWANVQVSGNKKWMFKTFDNNNYASMSGYGGNAPFDSWLISPAIDMSKVENKTLTFDNQVNGYGSTTSALEVYVLNSADPATAIRTKLNATFAEAPASGFSAWVNSGTLDLSQFTGAIWIGFRYVAEKDPSDNYATWTVDNVKLNVSGSVTPTPDPDPTPAPSGEFKGDFDSFNGGVAKSSPYATYTNATGWTAENSIILAGQDEGVADNNPYFGFIGPKTTIAPCLNGRVGKVGKLTSPTLAGGCKTLTFRYGYPYGGSTYSFTVNVLQNGAVVKTETVSVTDGAKLSAHDFSMDVNISGNFVIEIVNNCPSQTEDKNADRIAFWNLTWTD